LDYKHFDREINKDKGKLTHGTLLQFRQVREAAACANVVKVSLSAWDQASYGWVNRPHKQLQFDQLVAGQKSTVYYAVTGRKDKVISKEADDEK